MLKRMFMWGISVLFRLQDKVKLYNYKIFNKHIKTLFKSCGSGTLIDTSLVYMGLNNVVIGNDFRAGKRLKLRTFDSWGEYKYYPPDNHWRQCEYRDGLSYKCCQ